VCYRNLKVSWSYKTTPVKKKLKKKLIIVTLVDDRGIEIDIIHRGQKTIGWTAAWTKASLPHDRCTRPLLTQQKRCHNAQRRQMDAPYICISFALCCVCVCVCVCRMCVTVVVCWCIHGCCCCCGCWRCSLLVFIHPPSLTFTPLQISLAYPEWFPKITEGGGNVSVRQY